MKTLEIGKSKFCRHLIITKNIWRAAPTLKYPCNNYVFAISYESFFESKSTRRKMRNVGKTCFGNFYKILRNFEDNVGANRHDEAQRIRGTRVREKMI